MSGGPGKLWTRTRVGDRKKGKAFQQGKHMRESPVEMNRVMRPFSGGQSL